MVAEYNVKENIFPIAPYIVKKHSSDSIATDLARKQGKTEGNWWVVIKLYRFVEASMLEGTVYSFSSASGNSSHIVDKFSKLIPKDNTNRPTVPQAQAKILILVKPILERIYNEYYLGTNPTVGWVFPVGYQRPKTKPPASIPMVSLLNKESVPPPSSSSTPIQLQIQLLERKVSALEEEKARASQDCVAKIQKQNAGFDAKYQQLKEQYMGTIERQQADLLRKETEMKRLETELASAQARASKYQTSQAENRIALDAKQKEEWIALAARLEAESKQWQARVHAQQVELDQKNRDLQELKRENGALSKEIQDNQAEIRELKEQLLKLDEERKQLSASAKAAQMELSKRHATEDLQLLAADTQKLQLAQREVETLKQTLSKTNRDFDTAKLQYQTENAARQAQLISENAACIAKTTDLQNQLKTITLSNSVGQEKQAKEIERLRAQLLAVEAKYKVDLQETTSRLRTEAERCRAAENKSVARLESESLEITERVKRLEDLNQKLNDSEARLVQSEQSLTQNIKNLKATHAQEHAELQQRHIDEKNRIIQQSEERLAKLFAQQESDLQNMREIIRTLEEEKKAASENLGQLKTKNTDAARLRELLRQAQSELKARDQELASVKQQLAAVEENFQAQRQTSTLAKQVDLERLNQLKSKEIQELNQVQADEVKQLKISHAAALKQLQDENQALNISRKQLADDLDKRKQTEGQQNKRVDDLASRVNQLEVELAKKEEELQRVKERSDARLQTRQADLEAKYRLSKEDLDNRLREQEQVLSARESELSEKERDLENVKNELKTKSDGYVAEIKELKAQHNKERKEWKEKADAKQLDVQRGHAAALERLMAERLAQDSQHKAEVANLTATIASFRNHGDLEENLKKTQKELSESQARQEQEREAFGKREASAVRQSADAFEKEKQKLITIHKNEILRLNNEHKAAMQTKTLEAERLGREFAALQKQFDTLQQAYAKENEARKEDLSRIAALTEGATEQEKVYGKAQARIDALEKENATLLDSSATATQSDLQLEELEQENQALKQQLQKYKASADLLEKEREVHKQLSEERKRIFEHNKELQQRNQIIESELKLAKASVRDVEQKFERQHRQAQNIDRDNQRLQEIVNKAQDDLAKTNHSKQSAIDAKFRAEKALAIAQTKLKENGDTEQKLRQRISNADAQLERISMENRALRNAEVRPPPPPTATTTVVAPPARESESETKQKAAELKQTQVLLADAQKALRDEQEENGELVKQLGILQAEFAKYRITNKQLEQRLAESTTVPPPAENSTDLDLGEIEDFTQPKPE